MKKVKFHGVIYTMTPQGYGNYHVTKETKNGILDRHSTDSFCYDWMSDESQTIKHQSAKRALLAMFKNK